MASNKQLKEKIKALDPAAKVDGLTNAKLADKLKGLSVAKADVRAEAHAKAKADADAKAKADADAKAKANADAKAKANADAKAKADWERAAADVEANKAKSDSNSFIRCRTYNNTTAPYAGPVVAEGKSIITLKGVLVAGDPILPEYLPGGKKTFDNLCEKGYINND